MNKILPQTIWQWATLSAFVAIVMVTGSFIGILTAPDIWYAGLTKPPFNPPNWIFAPVWLVLYIFIAMAGWRTWTRDRSGKAMKAWAVQLGLNWLWSPVFFSLHWLWPALFIIVSLLLTIANFVRFSWTKDRLAAVLFVPYLAWVGFATLLNAAIAILN